MSFGRLAFKSLLIYSVFFFFLFFSYSSVYLECIGHKKNRSVFCVLSIVQPLINSWKKKKKKPWGRAQHLRYMTSFSSFPPLVLSDISLCVVLYDAGCFVVAVNSRRKLSQYSFFFSSFLSFFFVKNEEEEITRRFSVGVFFFMFIF